MNAEVFFGIIVPGAVFVISFVATWALYRHFSRKNE